MASVLNVKLDEPLKLVLRRGYEAAGLVSPATESFLVGAEWACHAIVGVLSQNESLALSDAVKMVEGVLGGKRWAGALVGADE